MAKKKALPKATKAQVERIDELGKKLHGVDWDERIRKSVFARPMTPNRARQLILQLVHTLGGKV